MVKKIILIPIIILLGLLMAWFFAGLMMWTGENVLWFKSMGPWMNAGGFMLLFMSAGAMSLSFMGMVFAIIGVLQWE